MTRHGMQRRAALLGLMLAFGAGGRARAGIVIDATNSIQEVVGVVGNSTVFDDTSTILVPLSDSYADPIRGIALSATSTGSASGVSFALGAAASADNLLSAGTTTEAFSEAEYVVDFHVDASAVYNVTALLTATSPGGDFSGGLAEIILLDDTGGVFLYRSIEQLNPGGTTQFDILPSQVTLVTGHDYRFAGIVEAEGDLRDLGSASATATATGGLTFDHAVPEPSSLALIGIGGAIGLGYGWRRRKAKLAA